MVWRCVPDALQQFHPAEFLQLHAAPVGWRTARFQPGRTLAAVLITLNARFTGTVAPQPVRAHRGEEAARRPLKLAVGMLWPSESVDTYRPPFESLRGQRHPCVSSPATAFQTFYNTVALEAVFVEAAFAVRLEVFLWV